MAALGVSADLGRLYDNEDPGYLMYARAVVEKAIRVREEQASG